MGHLGPGVRAGDHGHQGEEAKMTWLLLLLALLGAVWAARDADKARRDSEAIGIRFERLLDRMQQDLEDTQDQLAAAVDERDELLARILHDEATLETVFEDEEDADDFLASRKRAME